MTITLYKLEIFSKLVLSEEVRESNNFYEVSKLVLLGDVRDSKKSYQKRKELN